MRAASLALVVSALLAGCAGDASDAVSPGGQGAGDGTGAMRGLVVDEAVRPLAGANVTAHGPSGTLNATTGPDGLFAFDGLAPGVYLVDVGKEFYSSHQQAVDVSGSVAEPGLVKFQLSLQVGTMPYVDLYKFEGLFECGVWPTNGCANVNILTGIVLCSLDLPCFNATQDRSVELIWINGPPTYLQSEMVWEPTTSTGESLLFGVGAATRQELQDGFADGYNATEGRSPLMLTLSGKLLEESRIGVDGRSLLIQVSTGVSVESPVCAPEIGIPPPCGLGVAVQQPYTTYTHAFYGYAPTPGWLFTSGEPVPPPPA